MSSAARSSACRRVRRSGRGARRARRAAASTSDRGSARTGRERSASRPARSRSSQRSRACRIRCRAWSTRGQLLGDVGHDQLGGVGGRRGADVGHQVEQRAVGLVADRGHHRRPGLGDRADQPLVGERQQVLDRAAAPGDHDHVDVGVVVEPLQRRDHLARRRAGPASWRARPRTSTPGQRRVALSRTSLLGGRPGRGDQADAGGQERQRPLQRGVEQPLGGQQLPAPLELGEQLAEADHPDLAGVERERAAVGVVGRLGVDDDAGALDQRRVEAVEERPASR